MRRGLQSLFRAASTAAPYADLFQRPQGKDVFVIGSGPAGFIVATLLELHGWSTTILDKRKGPGGLLHQTSSHGVLFEVGANSFGSDTVKFLQEDLGVKHPFLEVKHQLTYPETPSHDLTIPPNPKSLWQLMYVRDIISMIRYIKKTKEDPTATLDELSSVISNPIFLNYLHTLFGYFSTRPAHDFALNWIAPFMKGSGKPMIPEGGTRGLVDALEKRYIELGGTIVFNVEYKGHAFKDGKQWIQLVDPKTQQPLPNVSTKVLIAPAWGQFPEHSKASLSTGAVLLKMKGDFKYPHGTHTIVFAPSDVNHFLSEHDEGRFHPRFAFHCLTIDPFSNSDESYGISVYFLSPRGIDEYSEEQREMILEHIVQTINNRFPGFKENIDAMELISPFQYEQRFDMKSQIVPRMALPSENPAPLPKPDLETGVFPIGNATNAPHEQNLAGAIKGAIETAKQVDAFLSQSTPTASVNQCPYGVFQPVELEVIDETAAQTTQQTEESAKSETSNHLR